MEAKKAVAEAAQNTNWEEVPEYLEDLTNPLYGVDVDSELKKAINEDQQIPVETAKEPLYVGNFKIHGTLKELTAVKQFLDSNDIKYIFKY